MAAVLREVKHYYRAAPTGFGSRAGACSTGAGSSRRNYATVETSNPPIIAKAIGPQDTVGAIGIYALMLGNVAEDK